MSSRPVYSTESGRLCPDCGKPVAACACNRRKADTSADGIIRIRRETKGRRGKAVTVISGFDQDMSAVTDLASQLKKHCGTGGSTDGRNVEIQGDKREQVKTWLEKKGFKVRLSGG